MTIERDEYSRGDDEMIKRYRREMEREIDNERSACNHEIKKNT